MSVQHPSRTRDPKSLARFAVGFRIGGKVISNLRYAYNIVLLTTSPDELQEPVSRVERAAKEYNMLINAAKAKVMRNTDEVIAITVAGGRLEQVDSFVYLGSKEGMMQTVQMSDVKDSHGHDGDGQVDENVEK